MPLHPAVALEENFVRGRLPLAQRAELMEILAALLQHEDAADVGAALETDPTAFLTPDDWPDP